jgi:hypothetical protein
VILISAGRQEDRINRAFARRGGPAVEQWNLPGAAHGRALSKDPRGYERRVVGFFDRSLLRG